MVNRFIFLLLPLLILSCQKRAEKQAVQPPSAAEPPAEVKRHDKDPVTLDILRRPVITEVAYVKHILITYDRKNPRFPVPGRDISSAITLVNQLLDELKSGADFAELMKKHSDDPETGPGADSIMMIHEGVPGSTRQMAVRLNIGEVGVVQSGSAFHIMTRIEAPRPVESPDSEDIKKREPVAETARFRAIHIAWRELKQEYLTQITPGALNRNQSQAAILARDLMERVTKGDDMAELNRQFGERIPVPETVHKHAITLTSLAGAAGGPRPDPHHVHGPDCDHGPDGHGHDHGHDQDPKDGKGDPALQQVPEITQFVLRLNVGETGIVTSRFGYHVVQRLK